MGGGMAGAIERVARLEPDGYRSFAAQVDDLLQARSAGSAGYQHAFNGMSRPQRFADRMDACK
jgi:hypothetical protein